MSTSEKTVFQAFLSWLRTATPGGDVQVIMKQYREHLQESEISAGEADNQLKMILHGMNTNDEVWPLLFDNIYLSSTPTFRTTPNALLEATTRNLPAGTALDVCTGEGRNAAFLAAKGWTVTGIDVSQAGLKRVQERAEALGVVITTHLEDSRTFDYGVERWDLILFTYAPAPLTNPAYVMRLKNALKPGGLILIESFAAPQMAHARRPVDLDPAALQGAFAGFELRLEEVEALPDWSAATEKVVRLVATKTTSGIGATPKRVKLLP